MVNHLAVQFCELVIGLILGTLIGAFLVQASCGLYNLFASVAGRSSRRLLKGQLKTDTLEPNPEVRPYDAWADPERIARVPGVPRIRFERAMRIFFFACLVTVVGTFILLRILRLAQLIAGFNFYEILPVYFVSVPLGLIVLAGVNAIMLPTSYGRGLLLSLLTHLLGGFLAAVVAGVVLAAMAFGVDFSWFDKLP